MPSSNSKKELLTNAFLIQFAFGIGCAIALLFILKGYFYSATIVIMPFVVSTITLLASFTGVLFLFLWMRSLKNRPKAKYKNAFFYCISISLAGFFILYFHKSIHIFRPLLSSWFTETQLRRIFNTAMALRILFYVIGLYMIIAFIVYIIRYNKCNRGNKT